MSSDLTGLDRAALCLFLLAWLGYGPAAQALRPRRSMAMRMLEMRRAWMSSMLARENRITDASLIGNVVHSATFFASTTVVALAALLGMLGNLDSTHAAVQGLDFTAKSSRAAARSQGAAAGPGLRARLPQAVLGGAAVEPLRRPDRRGAAPAGRGARRCLRRPRRGVLSLAVGSFDAGIRAYYFALAALAWLFGPGAFALATAGIVAMLLWRQFGSAASEAIRGSEAALWEGGAASAEPRYAAGV